MDGDEQFCSYRGDSLHSHSSSREILEGETLKSDCMKRGSEGNAVFQDHTFIKVKLSPVNKEG